VKNCFRKVPHLMVGLAAFAMSSSLPIYLFFIRPAENSTLFGYHLTIGGDLTALGIIVGLIFTVGNAVVGAALIIGFWRLASWAAGDN
jgi:hypothetical protein